MGLKQAKSAYALAVLGIVFLVAGIFGCSDESEQGEILGSPQSERWSDEELSTVQVAMSEFEIKMPTTLPAGPTKFVVSNNGQNSHNFAIEGPSGQRLLAEEPLKPGQKGEMQINLRPGSYVVYCPVFNNRDRGMEVNLTVKAE